MKIALDTTVLIDILNGDELTIQKIEHLKKEATLYTTTVNVYEVLRGVRRLERNMDKYMNGLMVLIDNMNLLGFDLESADASSGIYAELTKKGAKIDETDYLIAGCCLSKGIYTIVTRNEKHFRKIEGMKVMTY